MWTSVAIVLIAFYFDFDYHFRPEFTTISRMYSVAPIGDNMKPANTPTVRFAIPHLLDVGTMYWDRMLLILRIALPIIEYF